MYDLAASIIWPEYENRVLYLDYVRMGKSVPSYRTERQRQEFREFLVSIWKQMNQLVDEEAKGRINSLCGWCDYKTYCPEYSAYLNQREHKLAPLTEMDDAKFLEHWELVASKKTILESRQRELKMIANERFMRGDNIAANGQELYSTQAARTNYDIAEVLEVIPQEDLFEVLAVNKARLDRYSKDRPELKPKLSSIAHVSYNSPVFKIRSAPKEKLDGAANQDESAA
jgi:hypothetical protein